MARDQQQPEDKREKTLGQRIRAIRKQRGWSRERLAEEVGTTSLSIYRWETEKAFPRGDEIQLTLREVLGLPKDEFTKQREKHVKGKEASRMVDEGEQGEKGDVPIPIDMILPHPYWSLPLPSEKEVSESEIVEYKVPPIIVYKGFYERTFHEKYGESFVRRVTSNGKKLLPYDTWINPDTVIFGWGHIGGGSSHLAQSMLLDYFEYFYPDEQEKALRSLVEKYYRNFATDFTIWFGKQEWEVWSGAITAWLQEEREKGDPAPSHSLGGATYDWAGWSERWNKYKGT